jgi:hypothetical protein
MKREIEVVITRKSKVKVTLDDKDFNEQKMEFFEKELDCTLSDTFDWDDDFVTDNPYEIRLLNFAAKEALNELGRRDVCPVYTTDKVFVDVLRDDKTIDFERRIFGYED